MPRTYRTRSGHPATAAEALDAWGVLRDGFTIAGPLAHGDHLGFSLHLMDSAPSDSLTADSATALFRDAVGKVLRLVDADRNLPVHLTSDHVMAIEAEARRTGMPLASFVRDVLRYTAMEVSA